MAQVDRGGACVGFAIETKGLFKSYGARNVLSGLDLAIEEGTAYGLIGPNGAGKTTLYRILVGLLPVTSGEVRVLGRRPGGIEARSFIGYMTQAEALYVDLTVEENIRFFGRLYGLSGQGLSDAVAAALGLVQLSDRASSRVDALSGGMRRRTSLACAVVHKPRLLLLDEPTVGVDPELRGQFWDAFRKWTQDGSSLVVSTHHMEEAGRCDRLGLLRDGRLIAEGAPAALLAETGAATMEEAFLAFAGRQK